MADRARRNGTHTVRFVALAAIHPKQRAHAICASQTHVTSSWIPDFRHILASGDADLGRIRAGIVASRDGVAVVHPYTIFDTGAPVVLS